MLHSGCEHLVVVEVFKGTWWMSWHQEPMKDVGGRDSPRGVVNLAVIRGCPNGETQRPSWGVTSILIHRVWGGTWGSETSQYPLEEKTTVIP